MLISTIIAVACTGVPAMPCKKPEYIERPSARFVKEDCPVIRTAYRTCKKKLGPNACIKSIEKKEIRNFQVICMPDRNSDHDMDMQPSTPMEHSDAHR